jgi:hypothetical protein
MGSPIVHRVGLAITNFAMHIWRIPTDRSDTVLGVGNVLFQPILITSPIVCPPEVISKSLQWTFAEMTADYSLFQNPC